MSKHISQIFARMSETRGVRIRESNDTRFSSYTISDSYKHKRNKIKKQQTSTKNFLTLLPTVTDDGSAGYIEFNPCHEFLRDGQEYVMSFPEKQRRVVYCLIDLMHCKEVKVSNKYLAEKCCVSERTVQNATATLVADRIIIKEQQHQRSVNRYIFAPKFKKGKQSFQIWLNRLTPQQQGDYMMHNILPNGHIQKSHKYSICTLNINIRKREYIYKNSERLTNVESLSPSKEGRMSTTITDISPAKQKVLAKYRITTTVGVKLWAFSDAIIQEVYDNWNLSTFTAFINQCKHLSEKNSVPPRWNRSYELLRKHNLPETGSTNVIYELTSQPTSSSHTQISTERKENGNNRLPSGFRTVDRTREAFAFFIANKDKLKDSPLK